MKLAGLLRSSVIYIEIGQDFAAADGGHGQWRIPLDREGSGKLASASASLLSEKLKPLLRRPFWEPRPTALCAIGARGMSVRRIELPPAAKEDFRRMLKMQIEAEFPLPPEDLAWGVWRSLGDDGGVGSREAVVAAVKREAVEEIADIISTCGAVPIFTVAALARSEMLPDSAGNFAVLDIGNTHSEWVSFEEGLPSSLRLVPWGRARMIQAIAGQLQIDLAEAENRYLDPAADRDRRLETQAAISSSVDSLSDSIRLAWNGQRLYLTGGAVRGKDIASDITSRSGIGCEAVETGVAEHSVAITGLKKAQALGRPPSLVLQLEDDGGRARFGRPAPMKWAALAAVLALGLLLLPSAEALLLKPGLARKLAAANLNRTNLVTIDREMDFLRYLKDARPPYIEAISVIANSLPQGTRLDSLSMNRRGEISFRGNIRTSDQIAEFRAKLIGSGFFSSAAVEDQTPTPDRQQLMVRMSAQWKPADGRESAMIDPPAKEAIVPKIAAKMTNSPAVKTNTP